MYNKIILILSLSILTFFILKKNNEQFVNFDSITDDNKQALDNLNNLVVSLYNKDTKSCSLPLNLTDITASGEDKIEKLNVLYRNKYCNFCDFDLSQGDGFVHNYCACKPQAEKRLSCQGGVVSNEGKTCSLSQLKHNFTGTENLNKINARMNNGTDKDARTNVGHPFSWMTGGTLGDKCYSEHLTCKNALNSCKSKSFDQIINSSYSKDYVYNRKYNEEYMDKLDNDINRDYDKWIGKIDKDYFFTECDENHWTRHDYFWGRRTEGYGLKSDNDYIRLKDKVINLPR